MRLPEWIDAGFRDYQKRLSKPLVLCLEEIPVARRIGQNADQAIAREGQAMLAAIGKADFVVQMQVTGRSMSTEQLAAWLKTRMQAGRDLAFLIGGPDGLAPACRERADFSWSLSALTFPHALARVILAEQLYRAASLNAGHPYHRG